MFHFSTQTLFELNCGDGLFSSKNEEIDLPNLKPSISPDGLNLSVERYPNALFYEWRSKPEVQRPLVTRLIQSGH
jgi:hypothetical protein